MKYLLHNMLPVRKYKISHTRCQDLYLFIKAMVQGNEDLRVGGYIFVELIHQLAI